MNARERELAVQLEDATRQCGAMADLLQDIAAWIMHGDAGEWAGLVGRIDALLYGQVSSHGCDATIDSAMAAAAKSKWGVA